VQLLTAAGELMVVAVVAVELPSASHIERLLRRHANEKGIEIGRRSGR
jgi:hypothetical protein